MKKELAIALPLVLGANYAVAGTCSTKAGSNGDGTTVECNGTGGTLDNLGGPVTVQVSAGVALAAEDGNGGAVGNNDIAVSTCHESGSAAYFGDTGGGSMQKNADFGTGNCNNATSISYSDANSGATL